MDNTTKETIRRAVAAGVVLKTAACGGKLCWTEQASGRDEKLAWDMVHDQVNDLVAGTNRYHAIESPAPTPESLAMRKLRSTIMTSVCGTMGTVYSAPVWVYGRPLVAAAREAMQTLGHEEPTSLASLVVSAVDIAADSSESTAWHVAFAWIRRVTEELEQVVDEASLAFLTHGHAQASERTDEADAKVSRPEPPADHAGSTADTGVESTPPGPSAGDLDIDELERTTPPLDLGSGEWVSATVIAECRNIALRSLREYRTRGTKSANKTLGCDCHGRRWRKDDKGRTWYYKPSLLSDDLPAR